MVCIPATAKGRSRPRGGTIRPIILTIRNRSHVPWHSATDLQKSGSHQTRCWRRESRANSSLESGVQSLILAFYSRPGRAHARARAATKIPPLWADLPPRRTRVRNEMPEPSGSFNEGGCRRGVAGSNAAGSPGCLRTRCVNRFAVRRLLRA